MSRPPFLVPFRCPASRQDITSYSSKHTPNEEHRVSCPVCEKPITLMAKYHACATAPARRHTIIPTHNRPTDGHKPTRVSWCQAELDRVAKRDQQWRSASQSSPAPVAQEAGQLPLSALLQEIDYAKYHGWPAESIKRIESMTSHRAALAARAGQVAAPAMVPLTDKQALDVVWEADKAWRSGPKHSSPFALLVLRETERAHGINGLTVGGGKASGGAE